MKRPALLLALVAISASAACSSAAEPSLPTATPMARWDAAALQVADGLAAKLKAAGKACADYTRWSYALLADDYRQKGLPIPAAVTACTGDDSENLTFEVFADSGAAARFVEAKRKLLCDTAARAKLEFPGFVYLDGGRWILEPDEQETAVALAKILGGRVLTAGCS